MKIKILSLAFACLMLLTAASRAGAVAEGTEELRVNSNLELNTVGGTSYSLELGYGLFLIDYVEAGVFGGYSDDDFVSDFYIGAFGEYNFETGTELVPFTGIQLSIHDADITTTLKSESTTALVLGLYAGSKYFLTEMVALSGRLMLEVASDDIYADSNKLTDSNFTIDLGLSFFF